MQRKKEGLTRAQYPDWRKADDVPGEGKRKKPIEKENGAISRKRKIWRRKRGAKTNATIEIPETPVRKGGNVKGEGGKAKTGPR